MSGGDGRMLVIGLELGDGRLILDWSRAGHLPTLGALISEGTWGWLESTADVLHVSAWPSIYTGTPPGEHGVYFTFQPAPGLQGYRRFEPGIYGRPTFWQILSRAGRRCTVFDAPYTHPEDGFTGAQVFDWGTWAHYLRPGSTPAPVLRRLERARGRYPLGLEAHDLGLAPVEPEDMGRRLVGAADAKTQAALWLMDEAPWDLFLTVYGETHPAGHYCWTPPGRADAVAVDQARMRSVYQAIDRGIGALLARAGQDTPVMIVSGDGVGPNHAGWHLLPEVLRRLGYLAGPAPDTGAAKDQNPAQARRDPVKMLRDMLPKDLRKSLARRLPTGLRDRLARRVDTAEIDWSATRAFALPTDLEGYIRINLKGREPLGTVEPGEECREVCRDLSAALRELVDPATGRPLVAKVVEADRAFPGPRRAYLPDLVVIWAGDTPIAGAASPRIGTVTAVSPDPRPGTHSPRGFVLARGPSIPAGRTIAEHHIFDLAPTILSALGVAPPGHMAGTALGDLLAN